MQRLCRSHLRCIWCCTILVVFSYVLFDLLDIDGSNFRNPAEGRILSEERFASEGDGKYPGPGGSTAWPSVPASHSPARRLSSVLPAPAPILHRPTGHVVRPRAEFLKQIASSSRPETDPARRSR